MPQSATLGLHLLSLYMRIAIRLRYDDTTIPRRIRLYDGSDRNYDMRSIRL